MDELDRKELSEEQPQERQHHPENAVQEFYEHFRGVPLRVLDTIIAVCIVGLVLVVALGVMKARHIL